MNENEYTIRVNRLEMCRLMQACSNIVMEMKDEMKNDPDCPTYRRERVLPESIKMWQELHDKVQRQLDCQDAGLFFSELLDDLKTGARSKESVCSEMGRRVGFLLPLD